METSDELNFLTALFPLAGIIFVIALGVVFLNLIFHKNLYRQKLEREELRNLHHQDLLKSSIEVQETERKRIAQDLHDELGAALSIARMHLVQLEHQCADQQIQPSLQNVRSITEAALASMRRISHELMPPQLEAFGLVKALEAVANQINGMNAISIQMETEEMPRLPWPVELGLYRICMELINNTLKHALANQIAIHSRVRDRVLVFQYSDNGKGLKEEQHSQGLGLKNIEARVSSLKGTLTFDRTAGFSITLHIPLN